MELMQLRYFIEVAETQHVSQSAERLHIAQPALSQSIRRLENDLGVPLFVKRGRNVVLTEYGLYLKNKLRPILDEIDSLPGRLQTMANLGNSTLHLNVLAASGFVTDAVMEYKKNHPDIVIRLLQNTEKDLYDIEITTKLFYQHSDEPDSGQFVCTEEIFLAVPNISEYAEMTSVNLSSMKNGNFISLFGSKQLRQICDKFCMHAGFRPHISFESDSPAAVRNMIAANMGIGFWPEFSWGNIDSSHVKLLRLDDIQCSRDILITCRHNKTDNTNVEEFFAFLTDCFKNKKIN